MPQVVKEGFGQLFIRTGDSHRSLNGPQGLCLGGEIPSGAESLPFPRKDNDLEDRVPRDLTAERIQLKAHQRIHGIELLRTV